MCCEFTDINYGPLLWRCMCVYSVWKRYKTIVTSISNLALGYVDGSWKFGENKNLSSVCKNWKKIKDGQKNLTIITFASGNKLRF